MNLLIGSEHANSIQIMLPCNTAYQIGLSDDKMIVTGEKGYASARASHGETDMDSCLLPFFPVMNACVYASEQAGYLLSK